MPEFDMKGKVVTGGKWGINWQESLSPRGYPLAHVRSALIKELRRGNERAALFWALELFDMDMSIKVMAEIWADLGVFTHEDVGLADPLATQVVMQAKAVHDLLPQDDNRRRVTLAHAVCYLARTEKTRYVSELLAQITNDLKIGMKRMIPDYAIDMHTKEGREMGRGALHYLTEGAKLENESRDFSIQYRGTAIDRARKKEKK